MIDEEGELHQKVEQAEGLECPFQSIDISPFVEVTDPEARVQG